MNKTNNLLIAKTSFEPLGFEQQQTNKQKK